MLIPLHWCLDNGEAVRLPHKIGGLVMGFSPGQALYFPSNNLSVMKVRFIRYEGGRCVISFPSSGFERESRICIAASRLFLTEQAAEAVLKKPVQNVSNKTSGNYNWRNETRWDVPGDGWGRR